MTLAITAILGAIAGAVVTFIGCAAWAWHAMLGGER